MSNPVDARSSVFVLSPAHTGGPRCAGLLRDDTTHPLARRLRAGGVPIAEIFSFISTTYFRGKLAYAKRFATPPAGVPGVLIIAPGEGLYSPERPVDLAGLRRMAEVPVDPRADAYRGPLLAALHRLAARLAEDDIVVLLGSLATGRYLEPLYAGLGRRLAYPKRLRGLGEMQRGSMLRRCAERGTALPLAAASALMEAAGSARSVARVPSNG